MPRPRRLLPQLLVGGGIALAAIGTTASGLAVYVRVQREAAEAALAADRPAEARERLDKALAVCPAWAEWAWWTDLHVLAARAARLAGDFPAAEAHLNRGIKLNGRATDPVQLEFLLLRVQTGGIDEVSSPLFALVTAGRPEAPLILETLTKGYLQGLRFKLATGCTGWWLELDPRAAKAYLLRAFALEKLGNHKSAFADYTAAVEADPNLLPARLRVAEMLLEDKKLAEARPHLEWLARQASDDPQVQARVGMGRFLEGRLDEARRLMEGAAVRLPNDPALQVNLAQLDIQGTWGTEAERGAAAEARLRAVLKTDPSDNEAWYNLAPALRLQGKNDEAAVALAEFDRYKKLVDRANKLLQEVPDAEGKTAADYAELGDLLLAIGRERSGVQWLNRALDKDPAHPPTLRALAAYYEGKGDGERARSYRDRVKEPPAPAAGGR